MIRSKQRTFFRRFLGKVYYSGYKWNYWYLSKVKFAKKFNKRGMEYITASHKSPLFRKLAGVGMDLQVNKVVNLKKAIEKLNGLLIMPGETFSYWRCVGAITRFKGYKPGLILYNGKMGVGIGGGLCQLSNLIYWMTLHTPLTVKERWRHSYDVFPDANRTLPFGSGATCAYPYIDLQIVNNTSQVFQLKLGLTAEELTGEWRSNIPIEVAYEVFETQHNFQSEPLGGYTRNNILKRRTILKASRACLNEEIVARNSAYVMYTPYLETSKDR